MPLALVPLVASTASPTVAAESKGISLPNIAIFVGSGVGCDYSTVQQAVNEAAARPGADSIALANNASYTAQEIRITDAEGLTILGGFEECLGLRTTTPTQLSGLGGNAASVISHTGAGPLTLSRVDIVQGDAINAAGGLQSFGSSLLSLEDVAFQQNRGVSGGGLLVTGMPGTPKPVLFSGYIRFSLNRAILDGGAMFALDAVLQPQPGAILQVSENVAEGGEGGGFYLLNSSLRNGFACSPGFAFNRASRRGGGLFVHARGAVSDATFGSSRPCANLFNNNEAGDAGGAVFAFADGGPDAPVGVRSSAEVQLFDTRLSENIAPDGAALMVHASTLGNRPANAFVNFSPPHINPGPQPESCASAGSPVCPTLERNEVRPATGSIPVGAVMTVVGDGDGVSQATLNVRQALALGNSGGNIFRVSGPNASLSLQDALIGNSVSARELLRAENDARVDIVRSTFAGGEMRSRAVLFGDSRLTLERSIVHYPGATAVRMQRESNAARLEDVLVSDQPVFNPPGFPPDVFLDLFPVANAGFVDSTGGDFHLQPDSPAIDFWQLSAGEGVARDLDLRLRGYDAPQVPSGTLQVFDLGAYEYSPEVFSDGFEL